MSSSMVFLHCGCIIAFLARIGVNFSYLKPLLVVGGWCHLNILGALSSSFWVTLCHHPHLSKVPPPVPDGRLDWNWYWDSWSRKYRKEWNLGRKKKGKIVNQSTGLVKRKCQSMKRGLPIVRVRQREDTGPANPRRERRSFKISHEPTFKGHHPRFQPDQRFLCHYRADPQMHSG